MVKVNWNLQREGILKIWDEYQMTLILALREGKISVTSMRKRLRIGYKRAKRVFNELQESNYINSKGELNKRYISKVVELKRQIDNP